MDPINGAGIPDLSRPQGIVLRRSYLINMSAADVLDGGLHDSQCTKHLRVIDLAQGIAWYVPLNDKQLKQLLEQLT